MTQERLGKLLEELGKPELNAQACIRLYEEYIVSNGTEPKNLDSTHELARLIAMLNENWAQLVIEVGNSNPDVLILFLLKVGVLFEAAPIEVQNNFRLDEKSKKISQTMFRSTIQRVILSSIYRHGNIAKQSKSFWHQLIDHLGS